MSTEEMTAEQLWDFLDDLTLYYQTEGRGGGPDAAHARFYCKTMKEKIRARLKELKKPLNRPSDKRVYGPGQAGWQKAGPHCKRCGSSLYLTPGAAFHSDLCAECESELAEEIPF